MQNNLICAAMKNFAHNTTIVANNKAEYRIEEASQKRVCLQTATYSADSPGAFVTPSDRISIRHPVKRAAKRAFWPSFPIASES